jgi:hypothetical protein
LYGCESCYGTTTLEQTLKASQSRAPSIIFGNKREEATGGWAELYSKELRDLFFSHDIFKVMKLWKIMVGRLCSKHGEEEIEKGIGWGKT